MKRHYHSCGCGRGGLTSPLLLLLVLICLAGAYQLIDDEYADPYQNLIVEIKPDFKDCKDNLKMLESILTPASSILRDATGNLSFVKVTAVVPRALAEECGATGAPRWQTIPPVQRLTLGKDHPVFGKNPWTQQSRGCGKPGDFLYLPYSYMKQGLNFTEKAKLLIHEWSKYRWGVFEEYGLEGDPVFPLEYPVNFSADEGTQWMPNYCTDSNLNGQFIDGCEHPDCSYELTSNQTAKSSLLALPTVSSITEYCTAENHVNFIPTKQNSMCGGRSVTEIFTAHPDSKHPNVPTQPIVMRYAILENNKSKQYVLLLDETSRMDAIPGRWKLITSSLKQWILEDVLDGSEVGIVRFSSTTTQVLSMTLVNSTSRPKIADKIPSVPKGDTSPKKLTLALEFVESDMGVSEATVIMVVAPYDMATGQTKNTTVEAAGTNVIWPLVFPVNNSVTVRLYELQVLQNLASKTGGQMLSIYDDIIDKDTRQSLQVQRTLIQQMRQVQRVTSAQSSYSPLIQIMEERLNTDPCSFNLQVGDNIDLNHPVILYMYANSTPDNVYVDTIPLNVYKVTNTSFKANITDLKRGIHNITMKFPTRLEPYLVEVLAKEVEEGGANVRFWASHDFGYIRLHRPTDRVLLFAQVRTGDLPVVGADISLTLASRGKSDTLVLRDNGGEPDVTGNDGIYSTYWTLAPNGRGSYSMFLQVRSTETTKAIGEENIQTGVVCCGSAVNLSHVPSKQVNIVIDQEFGKSYVIQEPMMQDVFPPSNVTDLRGFTDSKGVNLTFTAPGEDLNRGYALEYLVWWKSNIDVEWLQIPSLQYVIVVGGSMASVVFDAPKCDQILQYRVTARDTRLQKSAPSNIARIIFPCNTKPEPDPIVVVCSNRGGAIAGAFFGGLAMGVLLAILAYFLYKKKHKQTKTNTSTTRQEQVDTNIYEMAQGSSNANNNNNKSQTNRGFIPHFPINKIRRAPNSPNSKALKEENKNRELPPTPASYNTRANLSTPSTSNADILARMDAGHRVNDDVDLYDNTDMIRTTRGGGGGGGGGPVPSTYGTPPAVPPRSNLPSRYNESTEI